jgi:DNA (cytosine-5)-methyltransferase 1
MLRLLDLFSGIGGFSLGMEATKRIKTIGFVEKDKFCQKVLRKNFKDVPIEEDIRNVRGERYSADIISGGFPCQPFSVAGKRKGTEDDRYLWDEMLRVITEVKPKFIVGENVQGIININNGLVLRQVQTDLEAQGFQVQCFLIPASGIGAWHKRNRVWIIAANSNRTGFKDRTEQHRRSSTQIKEGINGFSRSDIISHSNDNGSFTDQDRRSIKKTIYETQERENITLNSKRSSSTSSTKNNVANSQKLRFGGRSSEECGNQQWEFQPKEQKGSEVWSEVERRSLQNRKDVSNSNGKRLQRRSLSTNLETKQRQVSSKNSIKEQQTWWQTQSSLCGVPDGISYELDKGRVNRIKALGNAIVPQIAFEIGKAIVESEENI